jgi:serine-type D-Ala-D-Ala carboxypeptidase (penicillin-binding protein 5/6)
VRPAVTRFVPVFVLSLCALVAAALVGPLEAAAARPREAQPTTTAAAGACQGRQLPPPPIDTSEEPPPGVPTPEPLPVPENPVGGARMGECGLVTPEGAAAPPGDVNAASWVIADVDTGEVLAAKDPHARERPASLIKSLLAIVVIRELRPDMEVTGTQEDADQEGTKVGIGPGGVYTVDQLLHGLLMHSGNDVAHALARTLGGVDVALDKMNALAKEMGALDTRAATPSGLDGPGMTTSAYDQSLIFRAAMKHEQFVEAIGTRQFDFPGFGGKSSFKVYNDNKLLGRYEGFLGGKTGFTDDARHTYVGTAERGDHRLSVVMLRGERIQGEYLADQAGRLLDYGFSLADAKTKAVGELVDKAPEAQPKQDASNKDDPTANAKPENKSHSEAAPPAPDAFGNVGLPLVAFAAVVILVGVALYIRRRRARAARSSA